MAELIAGPTSVMQWVYSGGTIALNGDYRTFSWNPSTDYAEVTAGQDTHKGRLPTLKDATASITLVVQTSGTAIATALQPATAGTLIYGPEGTAVGKRKITLPAYCDGAKVEFPYSDVAVITCGFTGSSTLANFSDSTY